jgi:hypothetical protein
MVYYCHQMGSLQTSSRRKKINRYKVKLSLCLINYYAMKTYGGVEV